MRKKLAVLALAMCLVISFAGCQQQSGDTDDGNEPHTEKTVDYDTVYNEIIEEFYHTIKYADLQGEVKEGLNGVVEAGSYMGEDALDEIGYLLKDINNDGIKELLVGQSYSDEYAYVKNDLYAVYTLVGDSPVFVLEGRSRNCYSLMEEGKIYNGGSNGASYRVFGTYTLGKEGKLVCEDFNFSYDKSSYDDIGFFHNTTGVYEKSEAKEMDIDYEEFEEMENALAEKTIVLEFKPFSDFTPSGDGKEQFNGDPGDKPVFFTINGNWTCDTKSSDGQRWTLFVDLYSDGSAAYKCGPYLSELLVYYRGTWKTVSDTNIELNLEDEYGNGPFKGEFTWNIKNGVLTLLHVNGDAFVYSTEGKALTFTKK